MTLTKEIQKGAKSALEKNVDSNGAQKGPTPTKPWTPLQRFLFRIAFFFFILMSVPTSAGWYQHLVQIDWTSLHYRDLYDLARFSSGFSWVGNEVFGSNLYGYANWVITLAVSIAGALVWTLVLFFRKKGRSEYNTLYYWLRAVVRYRAGIGIIGFGFTKLLPVQMPYPSEALLNTDFGDFTPQKIFWLSIGIVPWYQVFTGVVELTAGALLFFRRTEALGAALLISALGTITYVNFAYDGGVHVYASYFVLLASFVLGYYIPGVYRLIILEKQTNPVDYFPDLSKPWQKIVRYGTKSLVILVFLVWFFYLQLVNFLYDPYKQPAIAGVKELRGLYDVVDFKVGGVSIAPSPDDDQRWRQVTFEKWSTLTFDVNKAQILDLSNGGGAPMRDINRTFEISGVAGGRKVFFYEADTINRVLYLQSKNVAGLGGRNQTPDPKDERLVNASLYSVDWIPEYSKKFIGDEVEKIHPLGQSARRRKEIPQERDRDVPREKMILEYDLENNGETVRLKGTNEKKQEVEILLRRRERDYLLSRSSLDAGKYDGWEK